MIKYLVAVTLLPSIVFPGAADSYSWQWSFGPYGNRAYVGTDVDAVDDHDSLDALLTPDDSSRNYINVATYHQYAVDGWSGTTGFYKMDLRSPLDITPGASKTWRIYSWNNMSSAPGSTNTDFTWHFVGDSSDAAFDKLVFRLTFIRPPVDMQEWTPPSPSGSPAVGETVLLNDRSEWNWLLWTYRTEKGLDGYVFDLTATVIPEPSSLAGICLALGGLGVRWRRRRR